jgi:multiple sugar transport system substrate-binding protein
MAHMFTDWIPALKDPESSKVTENWNFMPTPSGPKGRGTPAGTISISINADFEQEQKDAAFLFLKWALSVDVLKRLTEIGACPARLTVFNLPEFEAEEYRYFQTMKEMFPITRVPMKIPEFFELNDALSIELSAAIAGDKQPEAALDAAQAKWETIMKEAGYY